MQQKRQKKNLMKTNINIEEYGKLPPQAIDIEEILLGAIMLDSESFFSVNTFLKPEMFYKESHQKIYKAICDLADNYSPIDAMTVTENIRNKNELDIVGGVYYITTLTSKISSAENSEYYAMIIVQKYIAREGIRISYETAGKCYDDSIDIGDIIDYVYLSFDKLNNVTLRGETKSFSENIQNSLDEYEKRVRAKKEGLQVAYTTGLGALNKILIGWIKTEMTILAARPSVGKTALALYFAKECAKQNISVDIFSLEMNAKQISDRMILSETEINPYHYQIGLEVEWSELEKSTAKINQLPISINDEMEISINYIRSIIRKKHKKGTLGLVIIDYLQLMEGTDKSSKNNEIGSITRELKKLVMRYEFPLILLSQLSRDLEKRGSGRHKLSDLRDSGNIEQDADNVIFITRNRFDDEGNELDYSNEDNRKIYIDVAKHRNGSLGVVQCYCNEYVNRFYEKSEHAEFDNYYEVDNEKPF